MYKVKWNIPIKMLNTFGWFLQRTAYTIVQQEMLGDG